MTHIARSIEATVQHRVYVRDDQTGEEIARGSVVLHRNADHAAPYAFIEDIHTAPAHRGQGHFSTVMRELLAIARAEGCYKVIALSRSGRPDVHARYRRLGFTDHGIEFRLDLTP